MDRLIDNKKSVILFGGAFDPPTIGHCHTAFSALEKMSYEDNITTKVKRPADELWFLPSYVDVFGKKVMESFVYRVDMLKQMIKTELSPDYFKVCTIEQEFPAAWKVGTYEIILKLKTKYPFITFSFLIGSDELQSIKSWKNSEKLLNTITFIVVDRNYLLVESPELTKILNADSVIIKNPHRHIRSQVVRRAAFACSSSVVRKVFKNRRPVHDKSLHRYLCPVVQQYILDNHLYVEDSNDG